MDAANTTHPRFDGGTSTNRIDATPLAKQNRRRRTGRKPAAAPELPIDAALSGDRSRMADAIATVAFLAAQGEANTIRRFVDGVADADLGTGVDLAAARIILRAFEFGWLPRDVHEAARRRVDEFAVRYLTDLMAEHRSDFPADSVDEIWQSHLDELRATRWWTAERPHFDQWADRALLTRDEALTTAMTALALLIGLPKLEQIVALPGTSRQTTAHHHVDARTLGRVRGLLAKAESTSFAEEAETLSAKAQELMTKYAIDRALLDAERTDPDLPAARRIWLETPYTDAKALLIDMVARANRARAIFVADWGFVTIVGDDPDLDAVEILSTSLLVQATRTMIDNATTEESRSRHYRKAYLTAYATRVGERLTATAEATIADAADPAHLLPALAGHRQRVDDAFATYFPTARTRGITIRSAEGWTAGTDAADRAHLDNR
ncbi:DUF2786 domain-containing protein [Nocardia alba]|uniref:Uncharacterized protein DUF2786 n=1 Tax=Nocardia alba TaxID=225051 RepID=A0A4R1FJ15_9NOCA|nr:DUF2786 domain-containing protein [Nocardia alba]TCJ93274.1 uncharacterized protein DUF2786 [Nocardia alba]